MKWSELIKDSAWVVDDFLTREECDQLRERATNMGILNQPSSGDKRHRNSTTVAFDDEDLSRKLYDRIKDYIPKEVFVDKNCTNLGLKASKEELYGRWTAHSLNTRWRIAC